MANISPRIFHGFHAHVPAAFCRQMPSCGKLLEAQSPRNAGEVVVLQERIELSTSPLPRGDAALKLLSNSSFPPIFHASDVRRGEV